MESFIVAGICELKGREISKRQFTSAPIASLKLEEIDFSDL